jgi:phosphopantothenoylcysteine decarboxylase / phosphopantothenate---cysteine ligase
VHVAMTRHASQFVTPLTLQALTGSPVLVDLFDPVQDRTYGHLALARSADLFIVAPATADLIARLRAGMADDAVTTSVIACRCPVLLAPAMNTAMWENPIVQDNLRALLADPRYTRVGPNSGELADGDVGVGRLAEAIEIADAAEALLQPKDFKGIKVLVTAGPTREPIDPVRFVSNPSSGRMGYALARAAHERGAQVILISGPTHLIPPPGVEWIPVKTAQEMAGAVLDHLEGTGVVFAAAAVSDYRPKHVAPQKIKKGPAEEQLVLERTPDVLMAVSQALARGPDRPKLVGFAAETEDLVANARAKLSRKGLDFIVANDVSKSDRGFGTADNVVSLVDAKNVTELPRMSKLSLAHRLLDRVMTKSEAHDDAVGRDTIVAGSKPDEARVRSGRSAGVGGGKEARRAVRRRLRR